jgi:hypothetical protein
MGVDKETHPVMLSSGTIFAATLVMAIASDLGTNVLNAECACHLYLDMMNGWHSMGQKRRLAHSCLARRSETWNVVN